MSPRDQLGEFADRQGFVGIGALNIGLVMSRRAHDEGLPLDPEKQLSDSGSQVRGLNGAAGNTILADHGVAYRMGTESGRTNRGSAKQMRAYVDWLNRCSAEADFDLGAIEDFWVERIVAFFENKPFRIRREAGASLQAIISDLIDQAQQRQKAAGGAMVVGTVLQHLVGAKLEAALAGRATIVHHGANTSDQKAGAAISISATRRSTSPQARASF